MSHQVHTKVSQIPFRFPAHPIVSCRAPYLFIDYNSLIDPPTGMTRAAVTNVSDRIETPKH